MKKYLASILSLILALAMVFTLVACGSDSSDDDDDDDNSSKSSSSQSSDDSSDESDDESSKEDKDDDVSSKTSKPAKDDEEDTDSLVGDWKGTYYEFYDELDTNYQWDVYFTFNADGTYTMEYDAEEYVDAKIQYWKDCCEAEGTDFEDFLAESEYASEEEFRQAGLDEMDGYVADGEYEYDGSDFIIDGEEMNSEWDGSYFIFGNEYVEVQLKKA